MSAKSADRWSVHTYNRESGAAQERRTRRLLKDAETMAQTYIRCTDVDACAAYDNRKRRVKLTYGCFPVELLPGY